MTTFSSSTNRSESTRMYNSGQTQIRQDRLDDAALQRQILSIQEEFRDIDPDLIALIFDECDYNTQTTIERIKAGDFEDGGWQTAKSNNKKKNHNLADQVLNGGTQSDSERSLSQRTSPTSSLRGERQRKDQYQYPRTNANRRGNYSKPRHPPRTNIKPTETISTSKTNEEITPTTSSSTDEYEFIGGTSQSLTFDNSLKKSPIPSFTKRRTPSSIPQEPVSMHPTIQLTIKPTDIQFGDIQWNDSIPITTTPSNSPILTKSLDEQTTDVQDNLTTNIIETTNQLSSTSFDIPNDSVDETSHLSDQLIDSSQQQQQQPITSIPNPSPTSQTTNPFLLNTTNPSATNSSAFTPYSTPSGTFQSIQRDYPQTWAQPQSTNFKPPNKLPIVQPGNYPQQASYQLPPQQQIYLGTYPYGTPALYPVITPVDHSWSTAGYDPYSTYPATNYLPTYPTQPQYHPTTKHEQHTYDKDYFVHYGQNRLPNTDIGNSSQSTKDAPMTSKLSATAASFSQATSPAATFYFNPILYPVTTYYGSHQDRTMTYPSADNRDNRNGASYGGNNRNHYHQQQRSHNNSTRHSQQ